MPEQEQIIEISLDQILEPSEQVRQSIDEEELEALANSIKLIGQIEPIKVKEEMGRYRIIDGHMRYLASKMAGKLFVKAIVLPSDVEKEAGIRVHANIFRVTQDPLGEAEYFSKKMVDWGVTASELANRLRLPESRVRERLYLLQFPDDIQQAIYERKISLGVAKQLAKLENDTLRKDFIERAFRDGLTENRAKIWVEQYRDIGKKEPPPPEPEIEAKLKELDEYYSIPCEVCGEKMKHGDFTIIEGHLNCINDLRSAIAYEREQRKREKQPKTEERPVE